MGWTVGHERACRDVLGQWAAAPPGAAREGLRRKVLDLFMPHAYRWIRANFTVRRLLREEDQVQEVALRVLEQLQLNDNRQLRLMAGLPDADAAPTPPEGDDEGPDLPDIEDGTTAAGELTEDAARETGLLLTLMQSQAPEEDRDVAKGTPIRQYVLTIVRFAVLRQVRAVYGRRGQIRRRITILGARVNAATNELERLFNEGLAQAGHRDVPAILEDGLDMAVLLADPLIARGKEILDRMPRPQFRIYDLFTSGLKPEEIATQLHISLSEVRRSIRKSHDALREVRRAARESVAG
jgi:hypothetical protein